MLAALERLGEPGEEPGRSCSPGPPIAEELAAALREHPAAHRVEVAGSARRWAETCKDIDLIATAEEPTALAEPLAAHPLIAAAGTAGPNGVRAQTHNGVSVDLRIVAPEAFGNLLQHFTGSSPQRPAPRSGGRPRALGLRARDHRDREREGRPLRDRGGRLRAARLRLHRAGAARGTGRDQGRARGELPDLVELGDIRGDLHCHTTLSDGRNTLEEMAAAARERGYAYLAITDHSASHGFGDHVTAERLWSGSRRSRPGMRANGGSGCSPAPRSTSVPTARSTTPMTSSPRSTGSSPASTPRSRSRRRR